MFDNQIPLLVPDYMFKRENVDDDIHMSYYLSPLSDGGSDMLVILDYYGKVVADESKMEEYRKHLNRLQSDLRSLKMVRRSNGYTPIFIDSHILIINCLLLPIIS